MQVKGNRTFICSVVFIDIVEYTKKAVTEQIQYKEQLNHLLGEALKSVAANDRIILDTGDGAAISFVGDPEDALFVCLELRNAVADQPADADGLKMRIGINLGPVKLVKDLNGQHNIIGDGINVAQRIMGFAEPNQVLVSRSYYEVVSCLSDTYAKLFHYEGSRTDKHVREHEVYAIGDGTGEIRQKLAAEHHAAPAAKFGRAGPTPGVVDKLSRTTIRIRENLRTRPRFSTALAVVAILALALGMRGLRGGKSEARVEVPAPSAPAVSRGTQPGQAQPKIAAAPTSKEKLGAPVPRETTPAPREAKPEPAPAPREKIASAVAVKPKPKQQRAIAPTPVRRADEPAEEVASVPAEPGFLAFAISPWGEVRVDGKSVGVSPPLQEIKLSAGRHRVEVRNTTFTPLVQVVEVQPGERIRIRHRFK